MAHLGDGDAHALALGLGEEPSAGDGAGGVARREQQDLVAGGGHPPGLGVDRLLDARRRGWAGWGPTGER